MISAQTQKTDWLLRYQCGLAVFSVLIFFTNLDVYCDSAGLLPLSPLHWVGLFSIATLPLMFSFSTWKNDLPRGLLVWCLGYVSISLIWFWLSSFLIDAPPEGFQELRERILSILFLLVSLAVFAKHPVVQRWTRIAIIAAGLIATVNNIYEFFHPLVFGELNTTGRPAGFYVNSNNCGCALIEALIVGIGLLRPVYRVPYACAIGVGVFLTFSRGALLAWLVVMVILTLLGTVSRRQLLGWGLGLIVGISTLTAISSNLFDLGQLEASGLINNNVLERLSQTEGAAPIEDDSTLARIAVVQLAWKMFTEHPFLGNGIGSTRTLDVGGLSDHNISTHNQYLFYLTDHGFLGLLIYPLLIYAIVHPFGQKYRAMNVAMAAFLLIWGFFSHTLILLRLHLTIFALIATMNQKPQSVNAS